jgi:hypothetical protein
VVWQGVFREDERGNLDLPMLGGGALVWKVDDRSGSGAGARFSFFFLLNSFQVKPCLLAAGPGTRLVGVVPVGIIFLYDNLPHLFQLPARPGGLPPDMPAGWGLFLILKERDPCVISGTLNWPS